MALREYRKFHDEQSARALTDILEENKIKFQVSDLSSNLDSLYRGANPIDREIIVKIQQDDFKKVDEIWDKELVVDLNSIEKDHYLFEFSDEELFDILARPDEWSPLDYKLSIALLKIRGKNVDDDLISSLRKQRFNDLAKEESSQTPWIIIGYFASILGGILGIVIGLHLYTSKKTLPNGERRYSYSNKDRSQGFTIFILGIFFLILWVLARVFLEIQIM